jgi:hypothetical protein
LESSFSRSTLGSATEGIVFSSHFFLCAGRTDVVLSSPPKYQKHQSTDLTDHGFTQKAA